jgi:hypothetical protein
MILVQGYGLMGKLEAETPTLIRYGQNDQGRILCDRAAAQAGVKITNKSDKKPGHAEALRTGQSRLGPVHHPKYLS